MALDWDGSPFPLVNAYLKFQRIYPRQSKLSQVNLARKNKV